MGRSRGTMRGGPEGYGGPGGGWGAQGAPPPTSGAWAGASGSRQPYYGNHMVFLNL